MAEECTEFVVEMDCRPPSFKTQKLENGQTLPQETIDEPIILELDDENTVIVVHDVLDQDVIDEIISNEQDLQRTRTELRGHKIPRWEICYTNDGKPFSYSSAKHDSIQYPPHAEKLSELMLDQVKLAIPDNKYTIRSHGISLLYSKDIDRGGSISAHSDVADRIEAQWGLIGILSLGQARWMRFRDIKTKQFINVKLRHNSFAFMHGPTFQQKYTHQIDKLNENEEIGNRLSINIRYLSK